jgi:hypothetical protein
VKVYQDPAYGDSKEPVTHYAALVGPETIFSPEGHKAADPSQPLAGVDRDPNRAGIEKIMDGTSNTIAVTTVAPERKIPWAKPEDITVGPNFSGVGKPDGIATPYRTRDGKSRVFLAAFADGSVRTISDSVNPSVLAALVTRAGGEVVSADAIPGGDPASQQPPSFPVLKIRKTAAGKYAATIE